jgi:hypothetical protein
VRIIGAPQGMKTLIYADDGSVFDLQTAHKAGYIQVTGRRDLYGTEADEVVASLNNAAPNLALNFKNATAPAWEPWLCAVVGTILQAAALAVLGFATYRKSNQTFSLRSGLTATRMGLGESWISHSRLWLPLLSYGDGFCHRRYYVLVRYLSGVSSLSLK